MASSPHRGYLDSLPMAWSRERVGSIGQVVGGGTPSRAVTAFWGGDIPWITPGELEDSGAKRVARTRDAITAAGLAASGAVLLPAGALLVTTRATLGRRALAERPMATNQGFRSIVFDSNSSPDFYFHLTDRLKGEIARRASGTTFLEISGSQFADIQVPVPPLEEQKRIADVLDTLDDAIAASERTLAKERQLLFGLIDERVRAVVSDPRCVLRLGDLVDADPAAFIQTGPFGSQLHAWEYQAEGVPVFMPQDIVNGELKVATAAKVTPAKAASLARHILREGDVVVGRRGDLSRCADVGTDAAGGLCGSGSLLIRPSRGVTGQWLSMVYRHDFVQRQIAARAVGSTMMNLSAGLIRALRIPLPGPNERATIESSVAALTAQINSESRIGAKLRSLRAGIADDLLTGRVRTTVE